MSLATLKEKVKRLIYKSNQADLWRNNLNAYSFAYYKGTVLPDINPETLNSMSNFNAFCTGANVENIDFYIKGNNPTSYRQAFWDCRVKKMKGCNTSNADVYWLFHQSDIEEIEEPFDFSNAKNTHLAFHTARFLKKIRFVEGTIPTSISFNSTVLSVESIQSIFDGLATVSTAQTLTLAANLKILQSQVDSANAKGWTVAGGTVVSEEEYYG